MSEAQGLPGPGNGDPTEHLLTQGGLLGARLATALDNLGAVRIGESAVVSRNVHIVDPREPDVVQVLLTADAGCTFYHRRRPGEVLHVDVFHEVCLVNHRKVSHALRLEFERMLGALGADRSVIDNVDIQTGTGGGRITGTLDYGQKESLRRAHTNHVHLTLKLPPGLEQLVFLIVATVEGELVSQGIEPRAVARVSRLRATGNSVSKLDLTPYASRTDSLLKESVASGTATASPGTGPGDAEAAETGSELMRDAVQLVDDLRSIYDAWELLRELNAGLSLRELRLARNPTELDRVLKTLERRELVRREGLQAELTPRGQRLLRYFSTHVREIELALKKEIRALTERRRKGKLLETRKFLHDEWRGQPTKTALPLEQGAWVGELSVAETIVAAATNNMRQVLIESAVPDQVGTRSLMTIRREDIRIRARRQRRTVDVCLLIDASASMAGERLRAAKYLAQHLLFATRDRVAVLTFQERRCDLRCRFTRNYLQIEKGLRAIQPFGLTPLADGLYSALEYMRTNRIRDSLLLLITDGIPTVPRSSVNPLDDALEAADRLREAGVSLGCIGLQPNQRYLQELVARARGSLHVVDELDRDTLVAIAHQERQKHRRP